MVGVDVKFINSADNIINSVKKIFRLTINSDGIKRGFSRFERGGEVLVLIISPARDRGKLKIIDGINISVNCGTR
jgi:hypothetical protein